MCPAPVDAETPRGFIIPIGGGEDRVKEMQIHRKFVELSGGPAADIVVIPTASMLEETGPDYNRIFSELGARKVEFLPISRRADCDNPDYADIIVELKTELRRLQKLYGDSDELAQTLLKKDLEGKK